MERERDGFSCHVRMRGGFDVRSLLRDIAEIGDICGYGGESTEVGFLKLLGGGLVWWGWGARRELEGLVWCWMSGGTGEDCGGRVGVGPVVGHIGVGVGVGSIGVGRLGLVVGGGGVGCIIGSGHLVLFVGLHDDGFG